MSSLLFLSSFQINFRRQSSWPNFGHIILLKICISNNDFFLWVWYLYFFLSFLNFFGSLIYFFFHLQLLIKNAFNYFIFNFFNIYGLFFWLILCILFINEILFSSPFPSLFALLSSFNSQLLLAIFSIQVHIKHINQILTGNLPVYLLQSVIMRTRLQSRRFVSQHHTIVRFVCFLTSRPKPFGELFVNVLFRY